MHWCLLAVALALAVVCADEIVIAPDGSFSESDCLRLAAAGRCERDPSQMAKSCASSCAGLLHNAAFLGDIEMIRVLIAGGAAASVRNRQQATPLHFAAHANRAAAAATLLDHGAEADAHDERGATPLHFAAYGNHIQSVLALLRGGATPDARDGEGATAMHNAAYQGHAEAVGALIDGGAAVDAKDSLGVVPLHRATYRGHVAVVRALIAGGAALDVRNVQGVTPLHRAASQGEVGVVQALVDGGASIGVVDHEGKTALAFAAYHGHTAVAALLLARGADHGASDAQGKTPLQYAAMTGSAEVAALLLEHGAAVDAPDARGKTALHFAARAGLASLVTLLLQAGATLARSDEGVGPLETAIYHAADDASAVAIVRAMMEASTEARTAALAAHPFNGQTPLHIASYLRRDALCQLLRSHGAAHGAAAEDATSHLQRGDGFEIDGDAHAASQAYAAALRLDPSSAAVALRLSRSEGGDGGDGATAGDGLAAVAAVAAVGGLSVLRGSAEAAEGATAEWQADAADRPADHLGWAERAAELWRRQGVVVFPSLLNASAVGGLRQCAEMALSREGGSAADMSHLIRQGGGSDARRTLRPMPVSDCREALAALAAALSPFLARALLSARQLLLDFGAYATHPGAEAQEWHTDSPFRDRRIAHVQVSLVETGTGQGALEVQPASHRDGTSQAQTPTSVALSPVRAGTVAVYQLHVRHRGGSHARPDLGSRLIATLKLMGEHAFVPDGIPLKVMPEDAGRWWLEGSAVVDRAPRANESYP